MAGNSETTIPAGLRPLLGERDSGTRIFRAFGDQRQYVEWFDAITKYIGPTISPGGAAGIVHVSRAGVHKRIRTGKLTAFMFYAPRNNGELPMFLRLMRNPSTPYVYIPYEECDAWAKELAERGTGSSAVPGPDAEDFTGEAILKAPKEIEKKLKRISRRGSSWK